MRRLIAMSAVLAFVAAMAAPALAACRMRAAQEDCCCEPAPANSICAPDCCAAAKPAAGVLDVMAHARGLTFAVAPTPRWSANAVATASLGSTPRATLLVALHERATPRLPLRI